MDKINTKTMLGLTSSNSFLETYNAYYIESNGGNSQLSTLAKNLQEEEFDVDELYAMM